MKQPSILIVEDEAIISLDLSKKLRKLGYHVSGPTATGEEALNLARRLHPSLVLMDIHLAGPMDGITAADMIQKECQLPVVFMTAHSDKTTIQRAGESEAFDYIMKPFEDRDLRVRIEMALHKHAAKLRLHESESRLREVLENSIDASYKRNFRTKSYDYLSPVIYQITGYTSNEMNTFSKKTIRTLIHPDDVAEVERTLSDSKSGEGNAACHLEYRFKHKDGHYIWLHNQFTVMKDAEGHPAASIGIIRDITDRKNDEAERALLETQNMQLQKAESLGRMAGAIAHHFNNQLHVVMGNLEIAMNALALGTNPKKNLFSAMKATQEAAKISSMMLVYLGQSMGKREGIDLSETCRQSLSLLHAAGTNISIISTALPSTGPVIHANAGQVQHVLVNLLTNAMESTDQSRRNISLTVKTVPLPEIPTTMRFPIDWQPANDLYACIEVADTGSGIPEKNIDKIFDPFFSTKFTGRGLGLPVVLGIVRAHKGVVTVESKPSTGSVFRVFLPLSTEKSAQQQVIETPYLKKDTIATILLVEDEDMVRKMTAEMLGHLGYRVLEAKNGIEALQIFKAHPSEIRCVLTDLTMPCMNGWETLAALRRLSSDIPVILSSGYNESEVMAGEHAEKPNAFLGKPYQISTLNEVILGVLNNNRKH